MLDSENELKSFELELVFRNGKNVYLLKETGCIITEHKSLIGEYYPLSTKEILNVLDRHNVLTLLKEINIYNTSLVNTQAYVHSDKSSLTLYINSFLKHKMAIFKDKPDRYIALWSLLHEIGHLTDPNIGPKTSMEYRQNKAEPYADNFAITNIDKLWKGLIKE